MLGWFRRVFALLLFGAPATGAAQSDSLLPVDPSVTIGRLSNGLRYYIRENRRPLNRAELRLVVNAGSVQEEEDQRGLAHFVEHMAFNGTRNFAKQELVNYIESIGMRFGPDLNAYTSFDETVYQLQVPTDQPEILARAFQILQDWAQGITFDTTEIRKERGVVLEEWRLGRGAGQRMLDKHLPVLFGGSRYAERLPIGTPDCIQQCPPEALRRFYRTWYRPSLMAVVAVGDFDKSAIERIIRDRFGVLPPPANGDAREEPRVPPRRQPAVSIASDPEATGTSLSVYLVREPGSKGTITEWRGGLLEDLAAGMLNERLWELTQKPDPPFIRAGAGQSSLVRGADAFTFGAVVADSGVQRGLEAILTEIERAGRHGFTDPELERIRSDYLRALEQAHAEREKTESESFAGDYVDHFLTGDGIPGVSYEFQRAQEELPRVTRAEVDSIARRWLEGGAPVILVNTPEKNRAAVPGSDRLLGLFAEVKRRPVSPWVEAVADGDLVAAPPAPGRIVAETRDSVLQTTEWKLNNGATVVLRPTDFKADEILFQASSPGGVSLAADSLLQSARFAAQLVNVSGVGEWSAVDLQKKLAGKAVSLAPYLGLYEHGLSGQTSPRDAEILFQLVWLHFTAPRLDSGAVSAFLGNVRAALANRSASPDAAFQDTLSVTLAQHHPWSRPISSEVVGEINPPAGIDFYRSRFRSAAGFTFVLVGNLNPDSLRPLVEQYLAALPGNGQPARARDPGIRPPDQVVERTLHKGIEPKSQTALVFTGPTEVSLRERWILNALGEVLDIRLREELREELGGTYGVSISPGLARTPREQYTVSIRFGSDPGLADSLVKAIFQEIDSLQRNGPRPGDLAKVKETFTRSRETALRQNGWWLSQLMQQAREGDPAAAPLEPLLEVVTVESLREAARKYLDRSRYVRVTLLPQP